MNGSLDRLSRRDFLATSLAVSAVEPLHGSAAERPASAAPGVAAAGRIDCKSHLFCPAADEAKIYSGNARRLFRLGS